LKKPNKPPNKTNKKKEEEIREKQKSPKEGMGTRMGKERRAQPLTKQRKTCFLIFGGGSGGGSRS